MSGNGLQPRIGIVIPCYKQPLLADEALASVYEQAGCTAPVVAAVNDGCPMEETEEGLRAWVQAFGGRLHVLRRWNGGLSAARNTGARFLLARYPSLEALFFLDADNLLENGALTVFERLLDTRPGPDWFYPQFDMFGLRYNATNCGRYSLLLHTHGNMCEAGSLVRRRVFEAGVFFDESMQLGYEDWDFWLSAARHGFRGEPIEEPVFLYRKRPESMLSGSHRYDAELRSFLRRKHSWLYNPKTVLALEEEEAPRYRFLFDDGTIIAATDPLGPGRSMTAEEFAREVWAWIASEGETGAGSIWVAANRAAWEALKEHGLLRFAVWDLERRLNGVNLSTCILELGELDGFALGDAAGMSGPHLRAGLAAMGAKSIERVLRDTGDLWIRGVVDANPPQTFSHRTILLPKFAPTLGTKGGAIAVLLATILQIRQQAVAVAAVRSKRWRLHEFPTASDINQVARNAAVTGVLYPKVAERSKKSVCFLVSIAEFGGTEAAVGNVAGVLQQAGFGTALCLSGGGPIALPADLRENFDELLWFPETDMRAWGSEQYLGTALPVRLSRDHERDLFGILGSFDGVVFCHAAVATWALGGLRQLGVKTGLYEHVIEITSFGRQIGNPFLALAYEAVTDFVMTCSRQLGNFLESQGIPQAKLVVVPNAPGYPMSEEERQAVLARRAKRSADGPLRALFLGRFDHQKGLDRLVDVIERLQADKVPVVWRVVGKPVVDGSHEPLRRLAELVTVEAPVYDAKERTALYEWADVLVLPSRYEGLPLTVLEAQRCGTVPIVTRAGAIDEAISDQYDGFIVSQEHCVPSMIDCLARLAFDRQHLQTVARRAAERFSSWTTNVDALLTRMQGLLDQRHQLPSQNTYRRAKDDTSWTDTTFAGCPGFRIF